MENIEEVKYEKTTNYHFDIKGRKIAFTMEEIIILQEAFKAILNSNNDNSYVFLD